MPSQSQRITVMTNVSAPVPAHSRAVNDQIPASAANHPGDIVPTLGDQEIDLRPEPPSLEELMANGGRLLITWALKFLPYDEYLKTNHWQAVRRQALKDADYRCFVCKKRIPLDVHHVDETYKCRGEEKPADVVALCSGPKGCHKLQHKTLLQVMRAQHEQQFGPRDNAQ